MHLFIYLVSWLVFLRQGLTSLAWHGTLFVDQAGFQLVAVFLLLPLKCYLQACTILEIRVYNQYQVAPGS